MFVGSLIQGIAKVLLSEKTAIIGISKTGLIRPIEKPEKH